MFYFQNEKKIIIKFNKSTVSMTRYATAISDLQSFRHHYIPKFDSSTILLPILLHTPKNPCVYARKTQLDNDFETSNESFACCIRNYLPETSQHIRRMRLYSAINDFQIYKPDAYFDHHKHPHEESYSFVFYTSTV